MKDYVRRVLAKDTLKIAVVGDIDAATLGKLLDRTFGGLPAKASLTPVPDIEATAPPQRAFIPLDVPQTVVTFGGPGIKRDDPNFMAAYVVNHILGGGTLSSRLYHEVREKRGLAYSVYDSLLWMDHSALFVGNTGTRADRAGETVEAINKEVRRMAEDGPTQQELDEAKSYLKGSQMLALDTSSKLASALLQYQLDRLPIDYIEKRNAIVDAVTLDDARKAAQRLWGHGLITVIVGAPAGRRPACGRDDAVHGRLILRIQATAIRHVAPSPRVRRLRGREQIEFVASQTGYRALARFPLGITPGPVTPCCGFPATSRSTRTTSRSASCAPRDRAGRMSTSFRPRRNCASIRAGSRCRPMRKRGSAGSPASA